MFNEQFFLLYLNNYPLILTNYEKDNFFSWHFNCSANLFL